MKGIVFTEFFEMVEGKFGYEMVEKLIDQCDLTSNGSYTAIGTYPSSEVVQLVIALSKETSLEIPVLLKTFGKYLFSTFLRSYPAFFEAHDDGFVFLTSVDEHIHVEVRKLYPDASLPSFDCRVEGKQMNMIYQSERKLGDLAQGLIESSMEHFGHKFDLETNALSEDGSRVEFIITKTS